MFSVAVEGKANAVFDTADEALRFSMGHVYLSPSAMDGAKQLLERGEPYSYAYGFAVARITPVAKNSVTRFVEPDIVARLQDVQERFSFQGGSEFACNLADEIIELRRNNEELTAAVQAAILDVARFETGYRRYEKLRRLNARQLQELFKKSIETGVAFDALVDALFGGEK
jgi:hypothetical protein